MNNLGATVKNLNSYIGRNIASPAIETLNSAANSFTNTANNVMKNMGGDSGGGGLPWGLIIFIGLFIVALVLFSVYYKQIRETINKMFDGGEPKPHEEKTVTEAPPRASTDPAEPATLVNKVLPGMKEVFNVSSNRYTYADAEPLCRALGAELATYDQVKAAFDSGADWCNYGWTKGQLALYPTSEDTYNKLQMGPEEQRRACGRPGVNGGYFDNPDLRYGVNCYGTKPSQSKHDARKVASGDGVPLSPAMIDFDKKVNHYKSESDTIGILPFNPQTWG
jgi:hypothetical protein